MTTNLPSEIKWVAELSKVREVSIVGTADLEYWSNRLRRLDLVPISKNGRAEMIVIAAAGTFKGISFRELSFTIRARSQEYEWSSVGAYLIQAFNSRRLFSWFERVLFSTPYCFADVRVTGTLPTSIQLRKNGEDVFSVRMGTNTSPPLREGEDGWEGPVFLPSNQMNESWQRMFVARIKGHTLVFPFVSESDSWFIKPIPGVEVLRAFAESEFIPLEWAIRETATHAKSKTYKKTDILVTANSRNNF